MVLSLRSLSLQTKISLVLASVITPIFLVSTFAINKFTQPIVEEEMRQLGVTTGVTLATEIGSSRVLDTQNPTPAIENRMRELLYLQPNIVRVDVMVHNPMTGASAVVASNIEEEGSPPDIPLVGRITFDRLNLEDGSRVWAIFVPLTGDHPGTVRVLVSRSLITKLLGVYWKVSFAAAAFSVLTLILALSYFLRRLLEAEKQLHVKVTENKELTQQLQEAQREVAMSEKLAVMGQLTASFAHEIGTPLTAMGGHLQLLDEDIGESPVAQNRISILSGQLSKIEGIVKGFLQNTAGPVAQRQLVTVPQLIERVVAIVGPRLEGLGVRLELDLSSEPLPLRIVPVDLEQILLNLINNALDSIKQRKSGEPSFVPRLRISLEEDRGQILVRLRDNGSGISEDHLKKVMQPFFTTKKPGEGTGLGLSICRGIAEKYGGEIELDSGQEGGVPWTEARIRIPYAGNT